MRGVDIAIVGGGLAGGLLAWRLQEAYPKRRIALFEKGARLGGVHTWSVQEGDLCSPWIKSLFVRAWPGYEVRFPDFRRHFAATYFALRGEDFHNFLQARLNAEIHLGCAVDALDGGGLSWRSQDSAERQQMTAACVFDARGLERPLRVAGWQKFAGLYVKTQKPHGVRYPTLMDASVEQIDGFRFMYVLPWDEMTLLIEDTRYSDDATLSLPALHKEINDYAASQNWQIEEVVAEEHGALPLPLYGCQAPVSPSGGALKVGTALGLSQPTTGYSLPAIVHMVDFICRQPFVRSQDLEGPLQQYAARHWQQGAFFRRLNNMLFLAAKPEERRRILAQFYRRDEGLIGRFYRGQISWLDHLSLLWGRPPINVWQGLKRFTQGV